MNKNEIYEITIEDMSTDGEGIGHIAVDDSRLTIFVKDTVVGDHIRARIIKVKKNYVYGRLEELLVPSVYRVEPRCRKARSCGGCTLMQMSYAKQLEYKWNMVRNCLTRIGGFSGIEECMEPICGMESPYYYRNKMQFPVGVDRDGKVQIGFYAGHTHSIIDLDRCETGHPVNNYILQELRPVLQRLHTMDRGFIYDEETHTGLLRHILIRVGYTTGEVMVCFVINGMELALLNGQNNQDCRDVMIACLEQAVERYNRDLENSKDIPDSFIKCQLTSVVTNSNCEKTNRILGDTCKVIHGSSYITDYIGTVKFNISALSFYQVNPAQTRVLYDKAVEYAGLTGTEIVWDLYCGIGTITLSLAGKAGKVYGVEIVPQAIEDARRNAQINHIHNAEFFCGKSEEIVTRDYASKPHADVVVVDPPRKGCDPELLHTILKMAPARVVYVSCNPATLARDLKILAEKEYRIEKVGVVDQFAHSGHVECVAKLQRVNS